MEYGTQSDSHDGLSFNATFERTIIQEWDDVGGQWMDTEEVTEIYRDMLGRVYRIATPHPQTPASSVSSLNYYDSAGRLWKSVDPDGLVTLTEFDSRGRPYRSGLDINKNDQLDLGGPDRIHEILISALVDATYGDALRTRVMVYTDTGTEVVSETMEDLDSQTISRSTYSDTTETSTAPDVPVTGQRTTTTTYSTGLTTTEVREQTRLISQVTVNEAGETLASQSFSHDVFNRLEESTDARNGPTNYTYYADDRVASVVSADPDTGQSGTGLDPQTTSYAYYNDPTNGIRTEITRPDASVLVLEYDSQGREIARFGGGAEPVFMDYDPAGRLSKLTTWQDFDEVSGTGISGLAETTWNYNAAGLLESKEDDSGNSQGYIYTDGGRLKELTRARMGTDGLNPVKVRYDYDPVSPSAVYTPDVWAVAYENDPENTSAVDYTYNRQGQLSAVTDASGSRTLAYNEGALLDETYTAGPLSGWAVERQRDSAGRMTLLEINNGVSIEQSTTYLYADNGDELGRLASVITGGQQWNYTYHLQSQLVSTLTVSGTSISPVTHTMSYDLLNRLRSREASFGTQSRSRDYAYNDLNQRTRASREDGRYWSYGYDARDQVSAAQQFFSDDTAMPGYQFGYSFDEMGNRTQSTLNGNAESWSANLLNQYSSREVSRNYPVWGEVNAARSIDVTVDGSPATLVNGYFYAETGPLDNNAWYDAVDITASKSGGLPEESISYSGEAFLPAHPESFTHDADGNLTQDGRWGYTWNAENRLISMETLPAAVTAGAPNQRLEFAYDSQGRRFEKKVYEDTGGGFVLLKTTYFLYDGWNLIAEIDGTGALLTTYTWGLDLSGTLQAAHSASSGPSAGGVGGLLSVSDAATGEAYAPWYDGNGNVMGYINLDEATVVAEYEYGAFGEPIRSTGTLADDFAFQFSTKYLDQETQLLYYGFRYYDTETGRWLSRDPIGEQGGVNLYGFVGNDGVNYVDDLGNSKVEVHRIPRENRTIYPTPAPQNLQPKVPQPASSKGNPHAGPDAIASAVVNTLLSFLDDRLFRDAQAQCQRQVPYNHRSAASGCKCCVITIYYVQNNYSGFVFPAGSVGTVFKGSCSAAQSAWRSTGPTYKPSFTSNSKLQSDFSTFLPW